MEMLSLMIWPLVACLVLPWLLVYYGLHVVRRGVIFVDLALAQVAALGSVVAIVLGYDLHVWQNYACSLAFTVGGAAVFTVTRTRNVKVPQEALIGIVYVASAALAVVLLSRTVGGDEELRRTLVGEILVVEPWEIWRTLGLYGLVGAVHYVFRRQFMLISFAPEEAVAAGLSLRKWDFIFYVMFGFVVTSFVHLGGVLLVFSYLIVPAVGAVLVAETVRWRLVVGWGTATAGSVLGLWASFRFDLPTGAAVVCSLVFVLITVVGVRGLLVFSQRWERV